MSHLDKAEADNCFKATVTPSSREKSASVVSSSARLKNKGFALISVF